MNSIWNKEEFPELGVGIIIGNIIIVVLFYPFVRREIKLTVVITEKTRCFQLYTKYYPTFFCQR
jgi:hypothetical protein